MKLEDLQKLGAPAAAAVVGAGVVLVVVWLTGGDGRSSLRPLSDTPPPDYLYIDSGRVLSYLGQIEIGLAAAEKRTSATQSGLDISAGANGLSGKKSQQSSESVEVEVKPTAADRYYELLPKLIAGRSKNPKRPWLHEVSARSGPNYSLAHQAAGLCRVHEGDFVRIENAHLFLPPYAAILSKVRYAQKTVRIQPRPAPLRARTTRPRVNSAASSKVRPAIDSYKRALGANPRLPFIVPTLAAEPKTQPHGVNFFVPVRYRWLAAEPSLLSGSLTVVGKVTFRDLRVPGRTICGRRTDAYSTPQYFDQQTFFAFGPALQAAPDQLLASVGIERPTLLPAVRASVTLPAPMMVVVPLAIYQ